MCVRVCVEVGVSLLGLLGYKYELDCVQVPSDHTSHTMRLLALLLMIGAAGKIAQINILTLTHMQ